MNITSKTIKDKLKSNGYTCQKLGYDNRRPFNLGLHSQNEQKTEDSPFKMADSEYYYKIGGKTVTKAQYNAYENPVGDGPTKSTNDPDASGNKAKIQKNRSTNKASKRPTVLTKKQTELKKQGTKITKSPPFKNKWLDYAQTGLTAVGMVPGLGNVADGANAAISGGRAGYAKLTGDNAGAKKHAKELAVNLAAMVPGAGLAVGATKLASKSAKTAKALKTANDLKKATQTVKKGKKIRDNVRLASQATDTVVNSAQLKKDVKNKKYIKQKPNYTVNTKGKGSKNFA